MSKYKREIVELELERSRLNREKCALILNKSVFLYFTFMIIGVIGFVNGYISPITLNLVVFLGLVALIIGTAPYMAMAHKEQKNLTKLLEELRDTKNEK